MNAAYHSVHGSLQESMHVFINAGLLHHFQTNGSPAKILEIGMGTGLNVLLSIMINEDQKGAIHYTALEPHPLASDLFSSLNFCSVLNRPELQQTFGQIHLSPFETTVYLKDNFSLEKKAQTLQDALLPGEAYDIIYFDAFAPSAQPEMWSVEVFSKLHEALKPGGFLVTYCSKTIIRRAMEGAGFRVTKIPGPYGKREMVRAYKP